MTRPHLFLGNKNYSSWSLRPWLALTWGGIAFDETVIPLGAVGYGRSAIPEIRAVSPSGRVPALRIEGETIWDSLAICEWAAETTASLWPQDRLARARARAVSAEMHSSFAALRRDLPMNIRRRTTPRDWPGETLQDIARVQEIWAECLDRSGGPFLFGAAATIADAMFAPVATRFRSYGVALSPAAARFCEAVFADAAFQAWEADAAAETWTIAATEAV